MGAGCASGAARCQTEISGLLPGNCQKPMYRLGIGSLDADPGRRPWSTLPAGTVQPIAAGGLQGAGPVNGTIVNRC